MRWRQKNMTPGGAQQAENVVLGELYATLKRDKRLWRTLFFIAALVACVFAFIALQLKHHKTTFTPVFIQQLADGTIITREASNLRQFVPRHPAIVRHDVANYVQVREGWHAALFSRQAYLLCGKGSLSTATVCHTWEQSQGENARNSFLSHYGLSQSRTITIVAVNFIETVGGNTGTHAVANQNIATVVYEASTTGADGTTRKEGDYKATVTYRYRGTPLDRIRAFNNPLGFQVTDYRTVPLTVETPTGVNTDA